MIVYTITSLLELANNLGETSISFPFLESFYGKYSQKVTEDRKIPLFSRTSKYNNFPVRCQWKGGNSERPVQKYDKSRENSRHHTVDRYVKDEWRKDKENSPSGSVKMVPTKIQKVTGIKGLAIKVLNKITNSNFKQQSDQLLKILLENKEKGSVLIIANLILEKVWYDKGFYNLYVNLCKKLWENDEWVSEGYQILSMKKGNKMEYFYTLQFDVKQTPSSMKGPFDSNKKALDEAKQMSNFRSVFISLCRDNFYKRAEYITEAANLPETSQKYKLKRRLFGTVEILGHFFMTGGIDETIIHFMNMSLLHTDNLHQSGAKFPEEIEALKLLWDIVIKKMKPASMSEYYVLLQSEMNRKWCSRIKFMIEDMLVLSKPTVPKFKFKTTFQKEVPVGWKNDEKEQNSSDTKDDTSDTENDTSDTEDDTSDTEDDKNKELSSNTSKTNEKLTSDVVKLSRNYNDENKEDMFELLRSIKDFSTFSASVVSGLIKDSSEYGEYADNHSSTILSFLENYDISSLTFNKLSEALTSAGEDIGDLKIDAPKAPSNISFVIGKILKGTKTGKIEIDINKTSVNFGGPVEGKKEWENILKLTENYIDKETLTTRFEILKCK